MTPRDEIENIVHDAMYPGPDRDDRMTWPRAIFDAAAAILAAGYTKPRTITTVEELDALPGEVVIRDISGMVYELDYIVDDPSNKWWIETGADRRISHEAIDLPATVLYEPAQP